MEHDDYAREPVRGLPEQPPPGETILWQGAPNWFALAREALNVTWVAGYFVLAAIWRTVVATADVPLWEAVRIGSPFLVMGAGACALLLAIAWVMAKATVYTITTRRVAMRVGAALTMTLNLPYRWIEAVDLDLGRGGTGTLALTLKGGTRIGFLTAWPHTRPWRLRTTIPALRCIPDAAHVAAILADAAQERIDEPVIGRRATTSGLQQPALAQQILAAE